VLLVACWTVTTPPGASPDERAHHVKAVAAGHFEFTGRRSLVVPRGTRRFALSARSTRVFRVPAEVVEATFECTRDKPNVSAACGRDLHRHGWLLRSTYVGTYPPFLYVPAGLVGRLGRTPFAALAWERLVFAAIAAALLAGAALLVGRDGRHPLAVLGVFAAATPMVLFLAGSLNNSGVHIAAAIAFASILVAGARRADGVRDSWPFAAAAGAVLIVSRPEGVLWVALYLVVYAVLRRDQPRSLPAGLLLCLGAATAAVAAWQLRVGEGTPFGLAQFRPGAHDVLRNAHGLVNQGVGNFGWLDTPLPSWAYWCWIAGAAGFVATALAVAGSRHRIAIVVSAAVAVATAIVFQTVIVGPYEITRQLVQTRYVLPAALLVLIVAGDALDRRYPRPRGDLVAGAATLVALFDVGALFVYWRRNAVGVNGPRWFLSNPAWSPPLGWWLWLSVACASVVLVAATSAFKPRYALRVPRPSTPATCSSA
jgi:hypothetical protein